MDDFEKAVLFSFDQSGSVQPELKERAMAFLENVKATPQVWCHCAERFSSTTYAEVQFWCLQTLREVLRAGYSTMGPAEQQQVRMVLSRWLSVECISTSTPAFLRNKVVQIVIQVLRVDYPANWPSFFHDLIALAGCGPQQADLFCRVLTALDEEIISLEIPRTQEEIALGMRVKDAIRDSCVSLLVDTARNLLLTYQTSSPELGASVLEAVARYVHWVDIGLVASERVFPHLVQALASPASCVRQAALATLQAVVMKRMDPSAKLALLSQLSLVQLTAQLAQSPSEEGEWGVALKVTTLLTTLAEELLDCWKNLDQTQQVESSILQLLDPLFPSILRRLENDDVDICTATFPFIMAFVARVKKIKRVSDSLAGVLRSILIAVARRCRYPEGYDFDSGTDPGALEIEEQVLETRQELFTIFRNVTRLVPQESHQLLSSAVIALARPATHTSENGRPLENGGGGGVNENGTAESGCSFQEVEGVLVLLYELGTLGQDVISLGVGPSENVDRVRGGGGAAAECSGQHQQAAADLGGLVAQVLSWDPRGLPHAAHRLVALSYLELSVRYVKFLQQNPLHIQQVLHAFLGSQGLQHSSSKTRGRACYLFMRLVKQLRNQMGPYMDRLMTALISQSLPSILALDPPPSASSSSSSSSGASDDHLYAFEAAGLLISCDDIVEGEGAQSGYLQALLSPLCQRVAAALALIPPGDITPGPASVQDQILRALVAMGHVSKGFTPTQVNVKRPSLGTLLLTSLDTGLQVLSTLPLNRQLRSRVTALLHQSVDTLGEAVFPRLRPALLLMLNSSGDLSDTNAALAFLNQLTSKFKSAVEPVLVETLEPVLSRVDLCMSAAQSERDANAAKDNSTTTTTTTNTNTTTPSPSASSASPSASLSSTSAATGLPGSKIGGAGAGGGGASSSSGSLSGLVSNTETQREATELRNTYHLLLNTIATFNLLAVLPKALSAQRLESVLTGLVQDASSSSSSAAVRKLCISTLKLIISDWFGSPEKMAALSPPLRLFAVSSVGCHLCIKSAFSGGLNIKDANGSLAFGELVQIQRLLTESCTEEYLTCVARELTQLGCSEMLVQQYVQHLQSGQIPPLKQFAKQLWEQLRLARNSAAANGVLL